ncbi:MAG: PAS domain S-box protein [Promethearchaeota archaeon]
MMSKDKAMYEFVERDRLIWENFHDLIIVAEPMEDFKIEYINEDSFKQKLGYNIEDLIGQSFLKFIHSNDLIQYRDLHNKYAFDDQIREIRVVTKNNNYKWFEFIIKTFKNNRNQQKLFIILRDISKLKDLELKLKKSENRLKKATNLVPRNRFWDKITTKTSDDVLLRSYEMLRQSEAIFHTAIESLPFDFFMVNKSGYYVVQNTICKENWGDTLGKRPEDVASDNDTLAVWKENNERAFSGETVTGEVSFKIKGKVCYFYNIITPVYIDDKIEYILGVNIDLTDLKFTEQKLQESENKYRLIYENANDLIKVLNDKFEYEDLNENIHKQILGYSKEDLLTKNPLSFLHPEDRKLTVNNLSKILRKGKGSYQTRFKHKNGSYKWLEISARNFIDNAGNNKILTIGRDITDRKIVEHNIIESEEKFRTITEQSFMGIIILQDGIFKYFNEQARKLNGYSSEEIKNWKPYEFAKLIHPEDKEFVIDQAKKKESGEKNVVNQYKYRLIRKDGEIRWIENFSKTINYKERPADLIMSIDITDSIKAGHKLKESEEKFRLINENTYDLIAIIDSTFQYFYVNDAYFSLGYSMDDIINLKPADFVHPNDLDKAIRAFNSCLNSGTELKEIRFRNKDGHYNWFEVKGKTFKDKNGDTKILLVARDISERKKTEEKLRESEEKFRNIAEQSLLGIAILQDDKFKYVNHTFAKIGGRTVDELKGWGPREFLNTVHPEDRDKVLEQAKKRQLGTDTEDSGYECRCFKKNGDLMYVQNYSKTITFNSKFADLITTIDITDRKLAEHNLKASEEKYRNLYENSPSAILLISMKGDILDCNLVSKKLSGFTRNQLIGKNVLDTSFIPEKYIPVVLEDLKVLLKGKSLDPREIQLFNKNGNLLWISYQASLLDYETEKVIQLIIQLIDEKKKAEQELKEAEKFLSNIFNSIQNGICVLDADFNIISINPKIEEWFSSSKPILGKKCFQVLRDREEKCENCKCNEILNMKENFCLNQLYKERNGEFHQIFDIFSFALYDQETGKAKGIIKYIQDVSEQKKAEQRLKESESKYHELFETSPDGVILTDIKGNILECNSAIEVISGYCIEDFIGKNFLELEFYQQNALDILLEGYKDLFRKNNLEYVEFPIKRKDNKISWVQANSTLIDLKDQKFILTVIHDITSQKQAEEALKRSEEKFRNILETSSVGIMELDVINKKLQYANPKLLDMVGFKKEEITEDVVRHKIVHPKDLPKLLRTNEESELEFRIIDKQGKEKWLSGKKIPHYNENGDIDSIRVWLDDITEKKMYETLIYELNINFLNFTADIRNNIELLLNTGLQLLKGNLILYAHEIKSNKNVSYQVISSDNKIFMFDEKEFSEYLFFNELFNEGHDFPQTFFNINKQKYAKTDPFIMENDIKGCFGKVIKSHNDFRSVVCVFYKENPVITGQEKLVMFLICDAIEIEQRRWQVQRDLEEQNITLNKINKLKTELFSRTSHELKTPLISIKGFTELLLTLHYNKFDPEIISILEEIEEGSKRLEKIINLLLESTKLEAGQLELNPSEEDLTFLIKFCVKELRGLAKLRDQTISLDLHPILRTRFDKERIYEVISNLVVNAIKYTPPGGYIQIKSEIKNSNYVISIQDNGIGFTKEERNQIFKQFGKIERYGQGWDISTEGSGLGLYITKKLIELHGGKIWLESKGRNKGSTFYFSIPSN